jgi:hypothetical protein
MGLDIYHLKHGIYDKIKNLCHFAILNPDWESEPEIKIRIHRPS